MLTFITYFYENEKKNKGFKRWKAVELRLAGISFPKF